MSLTNYRDVGSAGSHMQAGFQFEFHCQNCSRTWRSPFEAYRRGQLAGLIYKFAYLLGDRGSMIRASGAVADVGSKRAHDGALRHALEAAEQRYTECPACAKTVCADCWDTRAGTCESCAGGGARPERTDERSEERASRGQESATDRAPESSAALKCPNCSCAISGGRFCEECGFDMASTHKSCPSCGTLCARATRFCADCGHGF